MNAAMFLHLLQAIPMGRPIWIDLLMVAIPVVPTTITAFIALLSLLQSRKNARELITTNANIAVGNEKVEQLKKNTDGMQTALLDLNSRANLAEGIKQGSDEERARPLVTEPQAVQEALKEPEVREKINGIEKAINGKNPIPVVDEQLAKKIDGIVTPKLDRLQDTVDEKKEGN